MARLVAYGTARDRASEHEPRTVTLTDDQALAIIALVDSLAPGGIWSTRGPNGHWDDQMH